MIHTTLSIAITAAIGGLWWYATVHSAARAQRWQARLAWREGHDITAGMAMLAAVDTEETAPPWRTAPGRTGGEDCPRCGGARCRPHREGRDCKEDGFTEATAYAAGRPIPREGRHSTGAALLRWVAGDWVTAELPITVRRQLGHMAGLARVPVVAGGEVRP